MFVKAKRFDLLVNIYKFRSVWANMPTLSTTQSTWIDLTSSRTGRQKKNIDFNLRRLNVKMNRELQRRLLSVTDPDNSEKQNQLVKAKHMRMRE